MDWAQITTILVAVITLIGVIIGGRISANKNLRDVKDVMLDAIRDRTERIVDKATDNYKESNNLHQRLTSEHAQILNTLVNDKREQDTKLISFSEKQKDTKQKVEEISDFLKDWERLIDENSRLRVQVEVLTRQCADLTEQLNNDNEI